MRHRTTARSSSALAISLRFARRSAFALTLSTVAVGRASAQTIPDRATALEVRRRFVMDLDTLQSRFLALANPFPRGAEAFEAFESKSAKDDVRKHLNEGDTKQQIEGLDPERITGTQKFFGGDRTIIETSFAMTDDLHEHLGPLIAYARMNGVVPPWSK